MNKATLSEYIKRRKLASSDAPEQKGDKEEYSSVEFAPKIKWFEMKEKTPEEQADEDEQSIQDEKIGEGPELYERLSRDEYQKFLEENGIDSQNAAIQTAHMYDSPETFDEDFKAENLLFTGQLPTVLPITPWDDKTSKIPTGKDAIFQDLLNKYKEKQNE